MSTREVRHVVFHTPGPAWEAGKSMFEQPGLQAHLAHYRQWLEAGKMQAGGPFLDSAGGGMMLPTADVSEAEVQAFAQADPSVQAGLLVAHVRPWMLGMKA